MLVADQEGLPSSVTFCDVEEAREEEKKKKFATSRNG